MFPWGTVAKLLRAAESGGNHAADRCPSVIWWIKRQPLTLLHERGVEILEAYSGFRYGDQIRSLVLNDAIQPSSAHDDVNAPRRLAGVWQGHRAGGHYHPAFA